MRDNILQFPLNIGGGVRAGVVSDMEAAARPVIMPVQTHSSNVGVIDANGVIPPLDDTDALICRCRGMTIGVRTADCVPVVLAASDICAVAAVHAGWKGTLGGIVTATVERLASIGADVASLRAAFGPSVCGRCYEVSGELAESFVSAGFGDAVNGRHVDLQQVNFMRLLRAGIPAANIALSDVCTVETTHLPSWRRASTSRRLLTWIAMD